MTRLFLALLTLLFLSGSAVGENNDFRRCTIAARGMGDLTAAEAKAIQGIVNQAGRPLEVVGSAARGAREVGSDIDYVVPPSSMKYFDGLGGKLPGIDLGHGIIPGVGNPNIGPVIRFEPTTFP